MDSTKLIELIHKHWNIDIESICLNRQKQGREVWMAETDQGKVIVKLTISAEVFPIVLHQKLGKARVAPKLWLTKDGSPFLRTDRGRLLFITSFLVKKKMKQAADLFRLISTFHRTARFPRWPERYKHRWHPLDSNEWIGFYLKRERELKQWSKKARDKEIRSTYEETIKLAKKSICSLRKEDLERYLRWSNSRGTIYHGDLHGANVLSTAENDYILDFDWSQIGPQAFDLHKLLPLLYRWDKKADIAELMDLYFNGYPEASRYRSVYYSIAKFPHAFFRTGRANLKDPHLKEIAQWEKKKYRLLDRLN